MVVLSKIRRADESLLVIASDDWAIHRVCKRFCKVSLDCHATSLRLMATAGRQLAMTVIFVCVIIILRASISKSLAIVWVVV